MADKHDAADPSLKRVSNAQLTISVKQRGAELCSIKSADGTEYLWQADAAVWPRHAPVLFPIVGRLAGDRYALEGGGYEMKQHGFARDANFECAQETATSLSYRLLPSPATRRQYPFEFALRILYLLKGRCLEVGYEVTNGGATVMPFSIGAHPGFSLALGRDDRIEDYFLEFEKAEPLDSHRLNGDHLLSGETERVLEQGAVLPLRADMFDRDALIFLGVRSQAVSLRCRRHARGVRLEFPGFPDLGIWSKPGAAFVCIEPWLGHADPAKPYGSLMNKPGTIKLAPGKTFSCTYRIVAFG